MAAYTQFGYNYPSANQLLNGVAQSAAAAAAISNGMSANSIGIVSGSAPSPLSGGNDASLSPSGGSSATTTGGVTTTGPLSPGAISQTSNNTNNNNNSGSNSAGLSILHSSTANAIGLSLSLNADVSGSEGDVGMGIDGAGAAATNVSAINDGTTPCCENGRPIITDPVSGQTVCSCQYDSARLALSGYTRMPGAGASAGVGVGVYGTPYPSSEQNPYPSIGVDSSAFYSPLNILRSRRLTSIDDIKGALLKELKAIPKIVFEKGSEDGKKRWHECIISNGDYFEKYNINVDK